MTAPHPPLTGWRALAWTFAWGAIATTVTAVWWESVFQTVPFAIFFAAVAITASRAGAWHGFAIAVVAVAVVLGIRADFSGMAIPSIAMLCTSGIIVILAEAARKGARIAEDNAAFHEGVSEAVADFVWSCDLEGRLTFLNQRQIKYLGLSPEEVASATWEGFVHPEDLETLRWCSAEARRTGRKYEWEGRFRRKDGSYRWFVSRGVPIKSPDGVLLRWLGTSTDIHDRKRAEDELRSQQQLLRSVIDHAPGMIYIKNAAGALQVVNEPFAQLAGRPIEEIIGRTDGEIFGHALSDQTSPNDARVFAEKRLLEFEETLQTPDGLRTFLSLKSFAEAAGFTEPVLVGFTTDITERKQMEAALRESEERFRVFTEALPQLVWVHRGDGSCEFVNDRTLAYTGLRRDEALVRGWSAIVHPDDLEKHHAAWTAALASGTEYRCEHRLRNAQGKFRWFLCEALAQTDGSGKIVRWLGTCTDIDERKRFEEERERLLTSERLARSEAEHASRMKDEFLATLSHELRTPLNAILGWTYMLHEEDASPEEMREGLTVIERNTRVQAQLIEDLLDMSRIVSGKIRLDLQTVELSKVVMDAVEAVRLSAEAKSISLQTQLPAQSFALRGDPARLQQVVWNLLSNAIKFTPPKGEVVLELQGNGHQVEISVRDSGSGISAEFLPHIFERFRQADASTTRRHGGLGLGLAIVKNLVELHGGEIEAFSSGEDQGTTFRVTFPAFTENPRTLPPAAADDSRLRGDHRSQTLSDVRILVVDDEADSREILARMLAIHGAHVTTAGSAPEALLLLAEQRFQLLISDIGMPEMDGIELIQRVRTLPGASGSSIAAIAVTAFAQAKDERRALRCGFNQFISKPVEPANLVTLVAECLAERELKVSS